MPHYLRPHIPGATVFLTIVAYQRRHHFQTEESIAQLKTAIATVKNEMPFDVVAAVVLPEHMHFMWSLPNDDQRLSARVGKMKILFTQAFRGVGVLSEDIPSSRRKHRESDVWQRRFIDHHIRDDADFEEHLNYIHYIPVKHGHLSPPLAVFQLQKLGREESLFMGLVLRVRRQTSQSSEI